MASTPYLSVASGLSEGRKVAIASRAAALALAGAVIALLGLFKIEAPDDGLGTPVVIHAIERR